MLNFKIDFAALLTDVGLALYDSFCGQLACVRARSVRVAIGPARPALYAYDIDTPPKYARGAQLVSQGSSMYARCRTAGHPTGARAAHNYPAPRAPPVATDGPVL